MNETVRWVPDPDHFRSDRHPGHVWSLLVGQSEAYILEKRVPEKEPQYLSLAAQKGSKTSNNHWIFFTTVSLVVAILSVPKKCILLSAGPHFPYDSQLAKAWFHSDRELCTWTCEYGFVYIWVGRWILDMRFALTATSCSLPKVNTPHPPHVPFVNSEPHSLIGNRFSVTQAKSELSETASG